MNDPVNLELNHQQRDLVLEGLRYIRSARRLAFRDPLAPPDEQRNAELRVIGELLGQLDPDAARATVAAR